eukprot:CAMPEP_0196679368 /NCGR_PEP_ID=MMETSP1090-20130531/7037_1 /TAXON_ID=37098 /ORGANISM="Isochrysis sp, Strain CCMP1244" /LENGTH=158 /DNA_ID=CAMNT_0042017601 /DNA_START=174 /DNA_END=648 /DNA_ORIENTATION=-
MQPVDARPVPSDRDRPEQQPPPEDLLEVAARPDVIPARLCVEGRPVAEREQGVPRPKHEEEAADGHVEQEAGHGGRRVEPLCGRRCEDERDEEGAGEGRNQADPSWCDSGACNDMVAKNWAMRSALLSSSSAAAASRDGMPRFSSPSRKALPRADSPL